MNDTVAILLSAYNSGKYLNEQIDSILAQTYKEWILIIRDDGSIDRTMQIVFDYCEQYSNIRLLDSKEKKLGAKYSFFKLLEIVNAQYYMFCDHDDVWLPNKIEITLAAMIDAESKMPNTPILVHTDLKVVDTDLKEISNSFWIYSKLKQRYLSQFNYLGACNGVTGCTMMVNNEAKKLALPISPKAFMHDYWLALKVAQVGKIIAIDLPTMLYRQHIDNEIGAKRSDIPYFKSKIKHFVKTIKAQMTVYSLLKEIRYGSIIKYYWYKICYTIIRNV